MEEVPVSDLAECGALETWLPKIGEKLDQFLSFKHGDAATRRTQWQEAFGTSVPDQGIGIQALVDEMTHILIPNGSVIAKPGFSSFITTGPTTAATLASLAASIASPQRIGITAFNHLEELSLEWMADLFQLPKNMKGLYSSGGSSANIVALGAARQWAFENIGIDPAEDGLVRRCTIYVSEAGHHTIHRAASTLGLGRSALRLIPTDDEGCMQLTDLNKQIKRDLDAGLLPIAVVANAGATSTGAIDPLKQIAEIAQEHAIWFHVDGAYGLPGILDPQVAPRYGGLEEADSVIVDPHKWLGAPVGIGATYVRDRALLQRAFTQGSSDYLEGSFTETDVHSHETVSNSMDAIGIPYNDFGLELSAPARGAVVWALLREIGKDGLRQRICRHIRMARNLADKVRQHPKLELLLQPTLSICCFRYLGHTNQDLDRLNQRIHRQLVHNGVNIPSTALIKGRFCIRPCFIGARTEAQQVDDLLQEVLSIGASIEEM